MVESVVVTSQMIAKILGGLSGAVASGGVSFAIFLKDYVIEGLGYSPDPKHPKRFTVDPGILTIIDDIFKVDTKAFTVAAPNTVYFVDFSVEKGLVMATTHSSGSYLALWQINTGADGTILSAVDMRGTVGGVQFDTDLLGLIADEVIVDSAHIMNNAVITQKLADKSVTNQKLGDGSVTTLKIADFQITTPKLADASITLAKLAPEVIFDTMIGTSELVDGAVTIAKLNNETIAFILQATTIPDQSITTPKLADGSVTPEKIPNLSIPDSKILALAFSKLTGKPTTAAGHGIDDVILETGDQTIAGSLTAVNFVGQLNGHKITVTGVAPTSPAVNDVWIDVVAIQIKFWSGSSWTILTPGSGSGGGSGDMLKATYDTDGDGIVDLAESVAWAGVTGKPPVLTSNGGNQSVNGIFTAPNFVGDLNGITFSLGSVAPGSPALDDVWFDTAAMRVKRYNGTTWVEFGAAGGGGSSGASDGKINVKDYGAVGNGIASDTAAFVAALNVIKSAGSGTLKIPRGTYNLANWTAYVQDFPLTIEGTEYTVLKGEKSTTTTRDFITIMANLVVKNVSIDGFYHIFNASNLTTVIDTVYLWNVRATNHRHSLLNWSESNPGNGCKRIRIERCFAGKGDPADSPVTPGYFCAISAPYFEGLDIHDNIVDGISDRGMYIGSNTIAYQDTRGPIRISRNRVGNIYNPSTSTAEGSRAANGIQVLATKAIITDNYVYNIDSYAHQDTEGIYTKCRYAIISRNYLWNAGGGEAFIDIKGNGRNTLDTTNGFSVICSHNFLYDDRAYGAIIPETGKPYTSLGIKANSDDVLIESNMIEGMSYQGIAIGGTSYNDITIRNNHIRKTRGSSAISVGGTGKHFVVESNTIYEVTNDQSSSTPSGVAISGSPSDVIIAGNQIVDVRKGPNSATGNGILIGPSTFLGAKNIVLRDNVIQSCYNGIGCRANPADDMWIYGNKIMGATVLINYSTFIPTNLKLGANNPELSGPTPIAPNTVAGLHVWMDASSLTALAPNAPVTVWADKVNGKVFSQGNTAFSPIFIPTATGGKPGVRFNGVNQNMKATVPSPTVAPTLGITVKGGTVIPSGTYYVAYTWKSASGDTRVSPEASITIDGGIHEQQSVQITAPATADGNITVTLDLVPFNVAVLNGDTAIAVADKIRAMGFAGWVTDNNTGTNTVVFTSTTSGNQSSPTFSGGTTGVTGTVATILQGVDGNQIEVTVPPMPAGVTLVGIYMGTVSGQLYSQSTTATTTFSKQTALLTVTPPPVRNDCTTGQGFASPMVQPNTIFVVARLSAGYLYDGATIGNRQSLRNSANGNDQTGLFYGTASLSMGWGDTPARDEGFHLFVIRTNGANSSIKVDSITTIGNIGTGALDSLTLGSLFSNSGWADADFCEMLVYDGDVSSYDSSNIEYYLKKKYSLNI